ncbi:MAG: hypothetical protein GY749_21745 [Desulfobacteraceae bacterium]|nr:hypothetical protein [Desulfobacteraceae bacterium]
MSVTKIKQLLVPTLCVGMQPGRSASCFRLPETVFLRTDPDGASCLHSHAERGNEMHCFGYTQIKLQKGKNET